MKTNPKLTRPELKIVVSNTPEAPALEPPPEQVEMPFAIVNGEPVTQMPRDLYIPPQAMEVFLEAFEGPLDLLLYLIRRQNLNILDIPLAEITRQYMKYIEVMTELQLELAGEYMVMAATLAEIKSRMLLPRPKVAEDGNEEDPRAELVRRLQEYERFKRAAESIDALPRLERDVWTTSADLKDRKVVRLLPQVTLQEMLLAFKDVVVRSEMFAHHHIQRERLSVRARMTDILSTLEHSSFVEFIRLFRPEEGRMGITVTFVAILELVRERLIDIVQAEPFAPLHVRSAGANRKLHVVAGSGVPGAEDEQVFADEGSGAGEAALADVAAIAGVSGVADDVALDGTIDVSFDPDFDDDDDDDLDDDILEGVDDVVDELSPDGADVVAEAQALAVEQAPAANEEALAVEQPPTSNEEALDVGPPATREEASGGEQPVLDQEVLTVDQPVVAGVAPVVEGLAAVALPAGDAETATSADVPLADVPLPAESRVLDDVPLAAEGADADVPAEIVGPSMADDAEPIFEQPAPDEIAVTFEPSLADVTTALGVTSETVAVEASVPDEPAVSDELAVSAGSAVALEPALSGDVPLDEQAPFDVEYTGPVDEVASAEQAVLDESDDEVSLIGETPVAGEVSLVGDESLSGGPVVEVDEFAFDELPALDEVGQADQQPAAGDQTGVKKFAGTDEPPSPGEESDE
jgi:segregation and condensation protein A